MSAVVGERDRLLRGTVPRNINPTAGKVLLLEFDPSAVHFDADGNATTPLITLTARPVGFDATVLWSITSGGTLSGSGKNVRTMAASSMTAASVKVTVTAVYEGQAYINFKTIYKVKDGKAGISADPADLSPEALVAALEGRIVRSSLYADLRSTIDLIDGPDSIPTTVAGQIKKETDARVAALTKEAADRTTYVQQYTYSEQEIDNSLSIFATTITAQYKAYADGIGGVAVSNATAYIQEYAYSKATSDSALTAMANTLRSEFATTNGVTVAYLNNYAFSKAETNSAIASATQTLSTTVAGHTATLQTQSQSIDGLSAQYTVKIDNNGRVSGFGLASTPVNGVAYSMFIINADVFSVGAPGVANKQMFTVGQVNGQVAMVLRGDMYADGDITARMLKISSGGGTLNDDPYFTDIAGSWTSSGAVLAGTGAGGNAPAPTFLGASGGGYVVSMSKKMFPIDSSKTYLLASNVYADGGSNRQCVLLVDFYDGSGAHITGTGWGDSNYSGYVSFFTPTPGNWFPYRDGTFGLNSETGHRIPAAAKTCRIGASLNTGSGNSATLMGITGLSLEEMVDSTIIGPGSIFTKHLDLATGGHLGSGQTGFDLGNGFWLEGEGRGHGARMSIGRQNGRKIIIDPANNRLELVDPQIGANMTSSVSPQQYVVLRNANQQFNDVYGGTFTATAGNASSNLAYSWRVESTSGYVTATVTPNGNQANVGLTGKLFADQEIDVQVFCRVTDLNNGVSRESGAFIIVQAQSF